MPEELTQDANVGSIVYNIKGDVNDFASSIGEVNEFADESSEKIDKINQAVQVLNSSEMILNQSFGTLNTILESTDPAEKIRSIGNLATSITSMIPLPGAGAVGAAISFGTSLISNIADLIGKKRRQEEESAENQLRMIQRQEVLNSLDAQNVNLKQAQLDLTTQINRNQGNINTVNIYNQHPQDDILNQFENEIRRFGYKNIPEFIVQ